MNNEYENDLEIDPDKLDQEWLNQPYLFMKYAEKSAEAKKAMDEASEKVKVIRSLLIKECKNNFKKATALEIESYYRQDNRHVKAKKAHIQAEFEYNVLNNIVFALHQRKTALENLVRLWADQYYSSPRTPENANSEMESEMRKKAVRDKIRNRSVKIKGSRRTK